MANVTDVAKYILESLGEITAMKLQKLVYYSQAWNLVWEEKPLFNEEIQAWANGAVVPTLYAYHRRQFTVVSENIPGNVDNITPDQKANINKVLEFYGSYTAQQLSDINHQEAPWIKARGDYPPMANCNNEIPIVSIHEYHSGIWNDA
jgi:uncharacterized phage-associated protein